MKRRRIFTIRFMHRLYTGGDTGYSPVEASNYRRGSIKSCRIYAGWLALCCSGWLLTPSVPNAVGRHLKHDADDTPDAAEGIVAQDQAQEKRNSLAVEFNPANSENYELG